MLCSVSENMKLSNSGLCKTLLTHGGKGLQDECDSLNKKLEVGEVVAIGGGKLPCKVVLLANLPKYTSENKKEVNWFWFAKFFRYVYVDVIKFTQNCHQSLSYLELCS